ncbi:MAG: 50S ribosomal protein L6 [Candidatus Zixiibacteriota bacterium]
MSKVGKLPIVIPKGVKVEMADSKIKVTGPKGELTQEIRSEIAVAIEEKQVVVTRSSDHRTHRSLHGLTRSLINNMVIGVSKGYTKTLEMIGVGYRAEAKGKVLELYLGFSHPIVVRPPDGVECSVIPKESKIIVTGINKQLVGQTAAEIRRFRPPEPYKGKGVRYIDEQVRRKAGKTAAK